MVSFHQDSHQKSVCTFLALIHATCTTHFIPLVLITWVRLDEEYKTESIIMQFATVSYYLTSFRPKYLPKYPFLKTHSTYVRPSVWETKVHTHINLNLHIFFITMGRKNILLWMVADIRWVQSALNVFMSAILIVRVFPKYFNFVTLLKD